MIYIIDDTIKQRKDSVKYLQEAPYSVFCKVIEYPTIEINKEIVTTFSTASPHFLFIHRSAIYYNKELKPLDNSENLRKNLIKQIRENGIPCVVFGRDTSNNKDVLFIDKDLLYRNLKLFLDQWIKGTIETSILYDGILYKIEERKKLLDKIITIINTGYPPFENVELKEALQQYLPTKNPIDILKSWKEKNMTKKEIRRFINDNL